MACSIKPLPGLAQSQLPFSPCGQVTIVTRFAVLPSPERSTSRRCAVCSAAGPSGEGGLTSTTIRPDFTALARLYPRAATNCFAGAGRRWKTRAFAPGGGTPEDAATGSAAGPLVCYLARHGRIPFGEEIEIHQGAEINRPSVLFARVDGDAAAVTRVEVGGSAVTVARGEFRRPG